MTQHRPATRGAPEGESSYRKLETGEDVTRQNVQAMRQLEEAAMAKRTRADRVASAIARLCGRMTFVWIHVVLFSVWIVYNAAPWFKPFDPYPFTFLTLVVSLEAIFLSTFILISQNYDMRISERRNQLDLQINLLAEQENTKALQILERAGGGDPAGGAGGADRGGLPAGRGPGGEKLEALTALGRGLLTSRRTTPRRCPTRYAGRCRRAARPASGDSPSSARRTRPSAG
jgi:uncharacterized membrane protein